MVMPAPIVSHEQKSDIVPHFSHLDLRNEMMTLIALLALFDTNTSAIDVIDQKLMLNFMLIVMDLRNAVVLLITALAAHDIDTNTNGITSPQKIMLPSIQMS